MNWCLEDILQTVSCREQLSQTAGLQFPANWALTCPKMKSLFGFWTDSFIAPLRSALGSPLYQCAIQPTLEELTFGTQTSKPTLALRTTLVLASSPSLAPEITKADGCASLLKYTNLPKDPPITPFLTPFGRIPPFPLVHQTWSCLLKPLVKVFPVLAVSEKETLASFQQASLLSNVTPQHSAR